MLEHGVTTWATPHQKPNPNTKLCITPPSDATTSCGSVSRAYCYLRKDYNINQFPDGTASDPTGNTGQDQADCWQVRDCYWDPTVSPGQCKATGNYDDWHAAAETVPIPPQEG
jgi:hypothetical protein